MLLQNIEFTRVGGAPFYFDASIPDAAGPHPAAIIVHGGGWVRGDRRTEVAPLFQPLTGAGIAWFSIDYRLAGDITQFGAGTEDVRSAIRFIKAHASEYRIDRDRIALVGESAGGQLAAIAALDPAPGMQVKAFVGLYAPMDLVDLAKNSTFIPAQARSLLNGTPFESMVLARLAQLSPSRNIKPGPPPFLLIHGTDDRLVPISQASAMCALIAAAGGTCDLYPVQGGGHGIRWWESALPQAAEDYKREMVRWLKDKLKPY